MIGKTSTRIWCLDRSLWLGWSSGKSRKTVDMVYQTCCSIGRHLEEAYGCWMMEEGMTHQDWHQRRVRFPKCIVDLVTGLLAIHLQIQQKFGKRDLGPPPSPEEPHTYQVSFPRVSREAEFHVEVCTWRDLSWTNLCVQFFFTTACGTQ